MSEYISYIRSLAPRTKALWWVVVILFCVFIARLFYVQVIRHEYYVEAARENQVTKLTIFPERGTIYTKSGDSVQPLVLNETVYTVFADPYEVKDADKIRSVMREVAGGEVLSSGLDALGKKELRYVVLARQVSRAQAELIQKKELDGVGLQKGSRRVYPEGSLAGQLLGYVNADGEGQYGIEEALDDRLTGTAGMLQSVTDVRRIPLTIDDDDNVNKPAVDGSNLVLSVDRSIQLKAEQVLQDGLTRAKATKGSIVVMNPTNGQVLAMANAPTYDPTNYTDVTDYTVFQNNVVSEPYENGSVMKTLTVGAGLDSGAVATTSTFPDGTGCTTVDGTKIYNVEEDPRQAAATMLDTLQYSLNTGVVFIVKQMGGGSINQQARNTFYSYLSDHYRFGKATGIEQAGEAKGTLISPVDTGEGVNVRYANMAFGQGMDITMIQTVAAFSAAVNGGTYYKPTLVAGTYENGTFTAQAPVVVSQNVLKPETSTALRDLIWQGRKRGFFGSVDPAGYKIGGKTGTSQVIDPKTGKYSNENSIGSYLGFGGADTPQYVIMVKVDDAKIGGYAGTTAAGPIFNDMSNWLLQYLRIQPR